MVRLGTDGGSEQSNSSLKERVRGACGRMSQIYAVKPAAFFPFVMFVFMLFITSDSTEGPWGAWVSFWVTQQIHKWFNFYKRKINCVSHWAFLSNRHLWKCIKAWRYTVPIIMKVCTQTTFLLLVETIHSNILNQAVTFVMQIAARWTCWTTTRCQNRGEGNYIRNLWKSSDLQGDEFIRAGISHPMVDRIISFIIISIQWGPSYLNRIHSRPLY